MLKIIFLNLLNYTISVRQIDHLSILLYNLFINDLHNIINYNLLIDSAKLVTII